MRKTLMASLFLVPLMTSAATVRTSSAQSSISTLQESSTGVLSAQQQAQQWGLSDSDWSRYQTLMKGDRGIMSPGLDPLTALGVETDNSAERRRLAELWVRHEYQRSEKELAFQREINAAWLRLYPETLAVNMGSNAAGIAHDTQGRLALFVKENCSRCDARLAAVLADDRPVDIYLVGGNSDEAIRTWAIRHNIPVEKVRSRQITLNHDGGLWLRYGQGQMPVILQQGENGWQLAAF
ncbi:TPA: TIGR03759 family integrating conjugative element protein [Klebsiella pneumoniae]|jgi:integrating conjugative element protein (TIGR03759 family)|uniref:TIGR03759 family integrating conjugative element protein n=1 Tax=Salmonella enterica TaxID=28901 RepID=A0A7H0S4J6_SALER|nr:MULTISPECIES: TIGR03759 family integrating conjugative element protein [Enterobacteriaceae]ECA5023872.1 TIGR03759 family integrating conjugative element protein [Salmonella enterica subsp. enterica serovar Ohio]ECE8812359.1 TIGR03759 family integrating conjugative element protein [Salmonella enterica subsp. enterica serovar Virchow]HAT7495860.1 TIGR03759 family integrating conjugative element protein [Raoultella ornithinolytica]HBQ3314277.1 TIGR03759 family integrating conjugative element pr